MVFLPSCTYLPLHQLLHSVFPFFFRNEKREGCADWHQQLTYFLMDTDPVGLLVIDIAGRTRGGNDIFVYLEMM